MVAPAFHLMTQNGILEFGRTWNFQGYCCMHLKKARQRALWKFPTPRGQNFDFVGTLKGW